VLFVTQNSSVTQNSFVLVAVVLPVPVVLPVLASTANQLPIGFDCASLMESKTAKRELVSNNDPDQEDKDSPTLCTVYANYQQAEDGLLSVWTFFPPRQDLRFTVDGVKELHKIDKACTSTGKLRALVH
jgi:hypothetical protein